MKYRVYIKQAWKNLLNGTPMANGYINSTTYSKTYGAFVYGEVTTGGKTGYYYVPNQKISVTKGKRYKLKKIESDQKNYRVFEYDSNDKIINYYIYDAKATYTPRNDNVSHIRLEIQDLHPSVNRLDESKFMFLESSEPVLIHDSGSPEKGDHLINPILELEDSKPGSFTFIIDKHHPYYNTKIHLLRDTIYITKVYSDGTEKIYWDGRPINEEIDASGTKSYYCEGALGYLSDIRTKSTSEGPKGSSTERIEGFIKGFITGPLNTNYETSGIADRSFYSYKSDGEYIEDIYKFITDYTGYKWVTGYDSGLKWLNDILESFGFHAKVKYRSYSSPSDDTICRILIICQDFSLGTQILDIDKVYNYTKTANAGLVTYHTLGSGVLFTNADTSATRLYVSKRSLNLEKPGYLKNYVSENSSAILSDKDTYIAAVTDQITESKILEKNDYRDKYSNYAPGGSDNLELEARLDTTSMKLFFYRMDQINKYLPKIHVSFGSEIFSGKKTTSMGDIASIIIPRGMQITNASGIETYIYLNTDGAFVDGNFNDKYQGTGPNIQGYRHFINNNEGNSIKITDPTLVKMYGPIEATVDFEDADTPNALKRMADNWMFQMKNSIFKTNIEISLSMLKNQIEYNKGVSIDSLYADHEDIDIWTQVYATIPELGIGVDDPEEHYYVSRLSIPLDDYLNTQITLANASEKISSDTIVSGDIKGTSKGIIDMD